jgi:hypothetical protein
MLRALSLVVCIALLGCDPPPANAPDASTGDQATPETPPTQPPPAEDDGAEPPPEPETPPDDGQKYEIAVGADDCTTDADCVKSDCCHPRMCVSKDKTPSCGDVACTLDCQVGAMDCYGGCLCQEGKCAAKLWMGPADATAG